MAPRHTKHHEEKEKNTELYDYLFKYTVNVPGSVATYNDHSEFKLRSERRMPDLFLPFSVCLQPVCFFFLMSCQGPGPPKTLWVKEGLKPQNGTGTGGLQLANDALWHTDLETAVPLDQTVIIWYLPLPCIILDVVHLSALFVCLFVLYNNAPSVLLSWNPNLLVLQHLFRWFKSGSSRRS